jgi:hypothetical protein
VQSVLRRMAGIVNRFFTLQPNEDIYFKHFANYQQVNATSSQTIQYPGILYVTNIRLSWISNDPSISDLILPWAEIKNDQYKTGKKSKYCGVRITSTHSNGDHEKKDGNVIYEFYLGKTTSELEIEIENCRNAIKKARQLYHGGELPPPNPSPATPAPSRGPISASSLSSGSNSTTGTGSNIKSSSSSSSSSSSLSKSQSILLKSSLEQRKLNLLNSDHLLRKEYLDLVEKNHLITSNEFWETHQHLLTQQECSEIQNLKGLSSSLLIEKTDFKNQKKIQINAEIIQEIFILNPIVKKVYSEKVPHELNEDEFWTQYFLSEYFTRDKAHLQSNASASAHASAAAMVTYQSTDDMFSRAEEEEKNQKKILQKQSTVGTMTGTRTETRAGIGAVESDKNISGKVAVDVDLTSTYGDYHPPERMEPTDIDITTKRSAVLEKYIRKSASVVGSNLHQVAEDTSSAQGTIGLAGHKRPYGDWNWSGSQYFSELQTEQTPDYLPLHLQPSKKLFTSSVQQEDPSHHHSHHSHHHSHHSHHRHHHHHSSSQQEEPSELNARVISRTLFHAFPSHTLSFEFFKSDLRQLASQSESKNSSFNSAMTNAHRDSTFPSFLSSSTLPTSSTGTKQESSRNEAVGIPQDLQKVIAPNPRPLTPSTHLP